MLKRMFRESGRNRPNELTTALLTIPLADLVRELVALFVSGELRFFPRRRTRRPSICTKFYRYHRNNPRVADWFLNAARALRDRDRQRYGIAALTEEVRWGNRPAVKPTDDFKISNDLRACYARLVLMRDPSLCGFLTLRPSTADALVIEGQSWASFAAQHAAELSAGAVAQKKPQHRETRIMSVRHRKAK
jgi:hypothetical protein